MIKPPTESSAEDKKADIRNRTLLGSVGFRVGSLTNFSVQIESENMKIEPAADRLTEHDLGFILLKVIAGAGAG